MVSPTPPPGRPQPKNGLPHAAPKATEAAAPEATEAATATSRRIAARQHTASEGPSSRSHRCLFMPHIMLARPRTLPTGFIAPCLPTRAHTLPSGGLSPSENPQAVRARGGGRAGGRGHGGGAGGEAWRWRQVDRVGDFQDTTPRPSGRPACALFRAAASRSGIRLVGGAKHSVPEFPSQLIISAVPAPHPVQMMTRPDPSPSPGRSGRLRDPRLA